MRSDDPRAKRGEKAKPRIWASGGQRPPFDLRAFGRASLHLTREGMAPLLAWAARAGRKAAIGVKSGKGRIPAGKLGKAERFVPSHLRVAAWIKNLGATLAHASATADPDVKRGNALVAEIEPHLWADSDPAPPPAPATADLDAVAPVVLAEPTTPADDPLASIRGDLGGDAAPTKARKAASRPQVADAPSAPPAPPGPVAAGAIQVSGYLIGWAVTILALPYGLARALWAFAKGQDLRTIGTED